jgi:F5/8 type C domain
MFCFRVRQESHGGAWCPKQQITKNPREWLEIDLHEVHTVTASETQGRFGNGQGQEFAEAYVLEYWRPRLGKWVRYRNIKGEEVSFFLVSQFFSWSAHREQPKHSGNASCIRRPVADRYKSNNGHVRLTSPFYHSSSRGSEWEQTHLCGAISALNAIDVESCKRAIQNAAAFFYLVADRTHTPAGDCLAENVMARGTLNIWC